MSKVQRLPEGWEQAYTRLLAKAIEVLGRGEKADGWLRAPNRALGGVAPLVTLDTEEGAQAVEDVLGRIGYGVFE